VGLAGMLIAGGLFASNMGFKLNYPLDASGTNGSLDGSNSLGLPFNQQTNLHDAEDLIIDINTGAGSSVVAQVCELQKTNNGLSCYTGYSGTNFALKPTHGYIVQVTTNTPYIVVGSHHPNLWVDYDGPGTNGSLDGTNLYSWPYHSTLTTAKSLIIEINNAAGSSVVAQVCQWDKTNNGKLCYTGYSGTDFSLLVGEAYFVQVTTDVHSKYKPSHY
jgi:hypothetical protein